MVQTDSLVKPLIVVCGPTASGKTALSVDLALELKTEIVYADSIAIYKDLDIGTAKPSVEEMRGVKHHLIGCVDADKDFTVAEYALIAKRVIDDIFSRGMVPIICGGTGYYIDAILYDHSYGNCQKDDNVRKKYQKILDQKGAGYLHRLLKEVDERSYETLHENDVVRVIRALEIYELSGKRKSEIVDEKRPNYRYKAYSFDFDRKVLYDRIERRVDKMIDDGLIEEVSALLRKGLNKNCQSMRAIGYKEVVEGLDGGYTRKEISDLIKTNTRRYAKRQITYFKRMEDLTYLDPESFDLSAVIGDIKSGLNIT